MSYQGGGGGLVRSRIKGRGGRNDDDRKGWGWVVERGRGRFSAPGGIKKSALGAGSQGGKDMGVREDPVSGLRGLGSLAGQSWRYRGSCYQINVGDR